MNKLFGFFGFVYIACTIMSFAVEGQTGIAGSDLTAAITATSSTITVNDSSAFLDSDVLFIDEEEICYDTKTDATNTFSDLTRGCNGTTPSAHSNGTRVFSETSGVINSMVGYNVAQSLADDNFFQGVYHSMELVFFFFTRAVPKIIQWDYSYLEGNMVYLKFIIFYPLSMGLVISIAALILRRGA
jgi:hypothetical protein